GALAVCGGEAGKAVVAASCENCSQAHTVPVMTSATPTRPMTIKRFTGPTRYAPHAAESAHHRSKPAAGATGIQPMRRPCSRLACLARHLVIDRWQRLEVRNHRAKIGLRELARGVADNLAHGAADEVAVGRHTQG